MKSALPQELAELVGILLGDGSINAYPSEKYSTFYRVQITLDSRELLYQQFVVQLITLVLGEAPILKKREDQNTVDILLFKKSSVEFFLNLGLVQSPKWERAVIPLMFMNQDLGKYILRGYFDTDGSVVITNNNGTRYCRLEMKICPSPMKRQLLELMDLYHLKYNVYEIGKGEIRVQMNGKKQLKRWTELIGFSNAKHQQRAATF
jgi:hypothetical protein